jgi:uncharacterized membrane protein
MVPQHKHQASSRRGNGHSQDRLVNGLGWFSIGLGLGELLAPGKMAGLIGIRDRPNSRKLLRTYGLREIAAGVGILSQSRPATWMWGRVAGDLVDLASLGSAIKKSNTNRTRIVTVTTAVLGVTALDVLCSQRISRSSEALSALEKGIDETKSIIVDRPAEELYNFWRDFSNASQFIPAIESVETRGNNRARWRAKLIGGVTFEWDTEVLKDQPNSFISWRSLPESPLDIGGTVRFNRAPGGRGTLVRAELRIAVPGGAVAAKVAKLVGADPGGYLTNILRRFKQLMETGEVTRSEASIYRGKHPAQPPSQPVGVLVTR